MTALASVPYRKCDRLCERLLVVLVWSFLAAMVTAALLRTTHFVSQAGVERGTDLVAEFVLCPSLGVWLGFSGVLLIWHEIRLRALPRRKPGQGGSALVVILLGGGVSLLVAGFFLALRILGG